MNIFVLDIDPAYAAIYHCDRHVVKRNKGRPWSKEFEQHFKIFLQTLDGADLLEAIYHFHCYGHECCMNCPLASHHNNVGKDYNAHRLSHLWGKRGWCGVMLCANESLKNPSGSFDFLNRGAKDGRVERALGYKCPKPGLLMTFTDNNWLRLMFDMVYTKNPRESESFKWAQDLIDPGVFLFKFLPIWMNRKRKLCETC